MQATATPTMESQTISLFTTTPPIEDCLSPLNATTRISDTYDPISALARTHPTETPYKTPPPPDGPNAPAIDGRGQTG